MKKMSVSTYEFSCLVRRWLNNTWLIIETGRVSYYSMVLLTNVILGIAAATIASHHTSITKDIVAVFFEFLREKEDHRRTEEANFALGFVKSLAIALRSFPSVVAKRIAKEWSNLKEFGYNLPSFIEVIVKVTATCSSCNLEASKPEG